MVELAAAMVRYIDPIHAMIERDGSVLRSRNPLDHQRDFILVLDQLHRAPIQPLLEIAAGGPDAAFAYIPLGDIALAPAVMRGIDGQAEGSIAVIDAAADNVFDKGVVASDIELVNAQRVGRGLGCRLKPRLRHRTQHVSRTELPCPARDGRA
jgi:hypothetical protein